MLLEVTMELLEALNHLYLLAFSLTGREVHAKKLLKDSLAYSERFSQLITQKGSILLDRYEIEDLEEFLLSYFQKEYKDTDISQKKIHKNNPFFSMTAVSRFKMCKFDIESKDKILLLKKEYIDSIIEFGSALKLLSFKKIDREQSECVLTRTALIRLLQTKEIISFKEHTSVCQSCFDFEKQFQKDMVLLKKEIPAPNSMLTEEELEDLIFQFQYPADDYAYLALHKIKKFGKKLVSHIN